MNAIEGIGGHMVDHGSFSGNPKTEWLVSASGEDREMSLLEDFSFADPIGRVWPAPKGAIVNGASIPRPLWSSVGSPYTDDYRRASVVHDVACKTPGVVRKDADVMFFHACRAGGCTPMQAKILYAGVRIGAWAHATLPSHVLNAEAMLFREELDVPILEEQFLQGKLNAISQEMHALPAEPTIDQMDSVIERHIKV
jgi:hypothetical protein